MEVRLTELRYREVINISDGTRLGFVSDAILDLTSGRVLALIDDSLRSCWTESGPYDEIHCYVRNNIAAVRDDLVRMAAGEPERAEMENYAASSMSLSTKDEIFSAMVVYGFLTYYDGCVSIPNHVLMLKSRSCWPRRAWATSRA